MFCPQCRSEYRPGFTHCNDCDVDLVPELPRETEEDVQLVKIFETGDPSLIPIVQSLLDDAQIEVMVKNPRTHDLFGTNWSRSQAEFWVRDDEAEQARALLADL